MQNANSISIAGGAIAVALIDALVAQNVLSMDAKRGILAAAGNRLAPYANNPDASAAARLIGELLRGVS
jgi:hypothetical protein